MVNTYTTYITNKVGNFFLNLRNGVSQMIGFYSTSAGGDDIEKNVALNYGNLSLTPNSEPVSAEDLTNSIFSVFSSASLDKITVWL